MGMGYDVDRSNIIFAWMRLTAGADPRVSMAEAELDPQ